MRDLVNAINTAIRMFAPQLGGMWVWQSHAPQHQEFNNYPNHGQPGAINSPAGGYPPQNNYPPQGQPAPQQQPIGGGQPGTYQYNPNQGGGGYGPR